MQGISVQQLILKDNTLFELSNFTYMTETINKEIIDKIINVCNRYSKHPMNKIMKAAFDEEITYRVVYGKLSTIYRLFPNGEFVYLPND